MCSAPHPTWLPRPLGAVGVQASLHPMPAPRSRAALDGFVPCHKWLWIKLPSQPKALRSFHTLFINGFWLGVHGVQHPALLCHSLQDPASCSGILRRKRLMEGGKLVLPPSPHPLWQPHSLAVAAKLGSRHTGVSQGSAIPHKLPWLNQRPSWPLVPAASISSLPLCHSPSSMPALPVSPGTTACWAGKGGMQLTAEQVLPPKSYRHPIGHSGAQHQGPAPSPAPPILTSGTQ